jgi:hypothetical protein
MKEPLYRKVNTKARGVHHRSGGDYRHERNTKKEQNSEATRGSMHGRQQRGLDYTPLFRFLLSKVGANWDDVFSEAVLRLDRPDPIFRMVALREHEKRDYFWIGEASCMSGLYVDEAGCPQIVNPAIGPASLTPVCACCTFTFNGVRFTKPYATAP